MFERKIVLSDSGEFIKTMIGAVAGFIAMKIAERAFEGFVMRGIDKYEDGPSE